MRPEFFRRFAPKTRAILGLAALLALPGMAGAEPTYGLAMYGEPALPADFTHLPQVNPDAPKGGRIVIAESGGFDSLNPFIRKGRTPWQLRFWAVESLMGRSYDEPFTLYCLLCETVETPPDRSWVEFTLRPEAKFSDGNPVTVDDVMWSYETLGTQGHPRYAGVWEKISKMEQTGPRSIRFTFNTADRELPLLMGMRPILEKAQWDGVDFANSDGVERAPITSSPYMIADFEPQRYLVLKRNPDYWGKDLPFMQGQDNLDEIRFDYYGDGDVVFEAFKAGEANSYRETNDQKWATQYDFPGVQSGDVVLSDIPHHRPDGYSGMAMNTRRPVFADWQVREALIQAFPFEFVNQTIYGGRAERIRSYFGNSVLAADLSAPATGRVADLLAPFAADIPPGAIEGYTLPVSDGSERNRAGIAKALDLMAEAGWTVQDGVMKNADGQPFAFDILVSQNATEFRKILEIYSSALARIGITPTISAVDSAQYVERAKAHDFDMVVPYETSASLSPGNEQKLYWGAAGADVEGGRNWTGVKSPAVDAMIDAMLGATDQGEFRAAAHALDRLLAAGRYLVPLRPKQPNPSHIAHVKQLHYPEHVPMYGDYLGFQPQTWWWEE